ncbi:MAG: DUF305 domain-containing protein, partial [Thermomicrobiales bacterium]
MIGQDLANPAPQKPDEASASSGRAHRASHPRFVPTTSGGWLLLAIAVAIIAGLAVFAWGLIPRDPGENSPEAGFLRDMQTHHHQAVEMAMIIRDQTSDEQLKFMATDIAFGQETEIGMMTGYLDAWGLSFAGDDPPMAWMDHPLKEGELMPGMATDEQLQQLQTLPVDEAEVLFLQLMIRHHQGGVEMAQAILARSDNALTTDMANRMIRVQSSEIDTMNTFLVDRGQ